MLMSGDVILMTITVIMIFLAFIPGTTGASVAPGDVEGQR